MIARSSFKNFFAALWCIAVFVACEKSSFNGEIEYPTDLQISGRVELADGATPEGIYVWLEDTPFSTSTDKSGVFKFILPPSGQVGPAPISGVFGLYFYVANYKLTSTSVTVHEGKFLYSRGEVNRNGELISTLYMQKLLNIRTLVDPPAVPANYGESINVIVTLSAVFDTVKVVFPKMIGGELAAILFKNIDTGKIIAETPEVAGTRAVEKITHEPRSFRFMFTLKNSFLPVGRYEVIPYFLIEQENMPAGLLASISQHAEEIGPDFLKIPFRRDGGLFAVRQVQ